jgi:hypothetical protein
MAAIDSSIYQEITIFSRDGSTSVDLRRGVVSFNYYEDLFSPTVTAKMVVVSTSQNLIRGKLQSIYNGLPIRGGELVRIKIAGNSESNPDLEFSEKETALYVSSVTNVISETQREVFTLNLVSKESLINETTRVYKKYPVGSISEAAENIIETLSPNNPVKIDRTTNSYGFYGNSRKPFTLLTVLASRAAFGKEQAGAFFYQTREGFFFSSVDKMITKKVKNDKPYIQTEVNKSSLERDNDYRVLSFSVVRNHNFVEKLRLGGYSSTMSTFDYWSGKWVIDDLVDTNRYKNTMKNLGQEQEFPKVFGKGNINIVDTPSRIMTQIVGHGALNTGIGKERDSEPEKDLRQAVIRYNTLFNQTLQMTVPLNSNLMAGDIIKCLFPKSTYQDTKEFDQDMSGLYMIKELCHHFDQDQSLTSMTLVRDTFGLNGTNNKN